MPRNIGKLKATDPNWKGEGIFERIIEISGIFVHRETDEMIWETKEKLWAENEIVETFGYEPEEFKNLIETKNWNKVNRNGSTLIWIAACHGHTDIVKIFAEKNADVNKADIFGFTPIMVAAHRGHIAIVKFLAEMNADVNKGHTNSGVTPISIAAQTGHTKIVKILAEKKADVNQAAENGVTPIWIAAANGHMEIVKFLAEKNADVNKANDSGVSPLQVAAERGHTEIVLLLEKLLNLCE